VISESRSAGMLSMAASSFSISSSRIMPGKIRSDTGGVIHRPSMQAMTFVTDPSVIFPAAFTVIASSKWQPVLAQESLIDSYMEISCEHRL